MKTMTTASLIRNLFVTALVGASSAGFAAPPAAAYTSEQLRETVKFGDLDVSHPQGAAVLYSRIRSAAEKVCSPINGGDLSAKMHVAACVNQAVADAVTAVNEPALLSVYSAKTGRTQITRVSALQNR